MEIAYHYPQTSQIIGQRDAGNGGAAADGEAALFGPDGLSFKDLVDVVNPLQQLPVVGSLYRSITGDTISVASRLAGGALVGGPVGFIAALANEGLNAITGGDMGDHLIAMLTGGGESEYASAANAYEKAAKLPG